MKETIFKAASSSSSDKRSTIRSVKSDGGSSVASKGSSYTPPNQAWSDYLTFRGVAVESPAKAASTYNASDIGRDWVSGGDSSPTKITSEAVAVEESDGEKKEDSAATEVNETPDKSSKDAYKAAFREMTPNKDLRGSEKSSGWLEEELKRRAFVKREINTAIEERGRVMKAIESDEMSEMEAKEHSNSVSDVDEEIAAITGEDDKVELLHSLVQSPSDGRIPGNGSMEEAPPRQLFGAEKPDDGEVVKDFNPFENSMESQESIGPPIPIKDMQVEMRKFASETRAALRDQSFTEQAQGVATSAKFVPVISPSPIPDDKSATEDNPSEAVAFLEPKPEETPDLELAQSQANRSRAGSKSTYEIGAEFADLQGDEAPVLIRSLDCFDGIAKGDITLSLLSENTGSGETSVGATWANRVKGAIWRSRRMRRSLDDFDNNKASQQSPGSPPVNIGALKTVASTQDAALHHLKHDEIDESIELFEEIIFAYYSYFERSLNEREKNPSIEKGLQAADFQLYIGVALHDLGVLNLLKGEYVEALSFFTRAAENRRGHLGEGHPDHIVSEELVVKELPVAITALENALMEQQILLRGAHDTIVATMDHVAVANILYNDQEKAAMMFRRILELQRNEYGETDRRCFVTIDKIKMVQSTGAPYEEAVDALHKTFTMPAAAEPRNEPSDDFSKTSSSARKGTRPRAVPDPVLNRKRKGKGVMKVLNSIRKKKP
ncbi:MAG: hypothetical protein SGILL_006413 [Bacillariaceae sp.]